MLNSYKKRKRRLHRAYGQFMNCPRNLISFYFCYFLICEKRKLALAWGDKPVSIANRKLYLLPIDLRGVAFGFVIGVRDDLIMVRFGLACTVLWLIFLGIFSAKCVNKGLIRGLNYRNGNNFEKNIKKALHLKNIFYILQTIKIL